MARELLLFLAVCLGCAFADDVVHQEDFEMFKKDIVKEVQSLKQTEAELRSEIGSRDKHIQELEHHVNRLEERCSRQELPVAQQRRFVYTEEQVAFTAYSDHHIHNLTHSQTIIYNQVNSTSVLITSCVQTICRL